MNLFSEIYNCYFQVAKSILSKHSLSDKELSNKVTELGYEESIFFLLPKLKSKEWGLYQKEEDLWVSDISKEFYVPLTALQRSYLKAIINDEKIRLFLSDTELSLLEQDLTDVEPLWQPEDFYYFDRFTDHDDYSNEVYKKHFRIILQAIKDKEYLKILYQNPAGKTTTLNCLPCRLEYSIKNDRFRLLALRDQEKPQIIILNLSRIHKLENTNQYELSPTDLNKIIQNSYETQPVCIHIQNKRNTLERAMLQFANYEKNTVKLDEDTYECVIYYNKMVETELLIEILSFGPFIKVVGNERFLKLIRTRLREQYRKDSLL